MQNLCLWYILLRKEREEASWKFNNSMMNNLQYKKKYDY